MKRPPRKGERALYHVTTGTGDTKAFAICAENYSPMAIEKTRLMESEPLNGYWLKVEDCRCHFQVCRAESTPRGWLAHALTFNAWEWIGLKRLTLRTTLGPALCLEEAAMVADLEQCAALMLSETEVK